jgi:hypothetical protein
MFIGQSLRLYRRCAALGDVIGLKQLGLCYEKGVGVVSDLIEAARFYERASALGSSKSRLSLGVFHWRGVGGFDVDRPEAIRLWRLCGLDIPDSAAAVEVSDSRSMSDSIERSARFSSSARETEETEDTHFSLSKRFGIIDSAFPPEPGNLPPASPGEPRESFALSTSLPVIELVVLRNYQPVGEFLREGHPAREIARIAGDGIAMEGGRCLGGPGELGEGRALCAEIVQCDDIPSLLRTCARIYTQDTFLYRRVNRLLRSSAESESDRETGRNLGLYIGLLRECFCVRDGPSPLSWSSSGVVYRGADFGLDILADYVRGAGETIRWQGFASSSRDRGAALGFARNVLFEILLDGSVPSLDDISAYRHEQEIVLTPHQDFAIEGVRWDGDCRRWILSVSERARRLRGLSWFGKISTSSS